MNGFSDFLALGMGGLLVPCVALFIWFRRQRAARARYIRQESRAAAVARDPLRSDDQL